MTDEIIKSLPENVTKFTANGNEYHVLNTIPLARYVLVREAGIKIIEGVDNISDLIIGLREVYEKLNKQKFADSAVKIHNLMVGLNEVSMKQIPAAFVMAACLIARKGEDLSDCSDSMIEEKINDWSKEGYDAESFFRFALSRIVGLSEVLKGSSQSTSQPKTINEALKEAAKKN